MTTERETTPYGVYIGENGEETLFNRAYQPLFTRDKDYLNVTPCLPSMWIHHKKEKFFFDDWTSPLLEGKHAQEFKHRCAAVLEAFHNRMPIDAYVYRDPDKE